MVSTNNVRSRLNLKDIYFSSIQFKNSGGSTAACVETEVRFNLLKPEMLGARLTVKLQCVVSNGNYNLDIILVGEFESDNEAFVQRMLPNAVAILFPYMRSQVSLLTAQPNMVPVVLPAINVNALIEKKDQQL